ncbi:Uncharacterised protein [Mycobacteroides abscessus subsp. abscessus]|nr:Uncharacterised protein [Mycobacteroides abscessus subsp. abscessus]
MYTTTTQTRLCDGERTPLGTQHVLGRNAGVGEARIGLVFTEPVHRDVPDDLDSGRVRVDDEHRHSLIGTDFGVGDGHDDPKRGVPRLGVEPLLTIEDPFVTVTDGGGLEQRRIRSSLRLGHHITGPDVAVHQWLQVFGLLSFGAVVREDLGIAGIGCLASEDRRSPHRPTQNLVEQRQLELAVTRTTQLRSQMTCPQAAALDLFLERPHVIHGRPVGLVVWVGEHVIEGFDLGADKLVGPVKQFLVFRVGFEIPCHVGHFLSVGAWSACSSGRST